MPTAAELQIVIEAQDRASAQLRQIGQEVQRLERQVEGVQRGGRGGGVLGGLQLGAGFAAAQQAFAGLQGLVDFVTESVVGLNSRLEQSSAAFEALTGSAGAARELLRITREEAARGFDVRQVEEAGRTLVTSAQGSVGLYFRRELVPAGTFAGPGVRAPLPGVEEVGYARWRPKSRPCRRRKSPPWTPPPAPRPWPRPGA
jgi:hypothetical protein